MTSDMSARLPELPFPDHVDAFGENSYNADQMRDYAIAALSALPAGGGKDESLIDLILRLEQGAQDDYEEGIQSGNNEQSNDAAGRLAVVNAIGRKVGCLVDTTPQPSAVSFDPASIGPFTAAAALMQATDAAVGAQGEAKPLMKCICTSEGAGCTNRCDRGQLSIIPATTVRIESAAPAAGKGVDDAMVERAESVYYTRIGKSCQPQIVRREAMRAALEAALTRQPVAGDVCKHEWVSGDNKYVSNTLVCQRCYEIKPAATPTDGGEG